MVGEFERNFTMNADLAIAQSNKTDRTGVPALNLFFLMIRRPPRSTRLNTLLPYTTLFRSDQVLHLHVLRIAADAGGDPDARLPRRDRKSTRLNSSHIEPSRMPSSA